MPDIIVTLQGRGRITFPEGTSDSVIDETIAKEFPKDGSDVARIIAEDPTQAKSLSNEDFGLYEEFLDKKKTDFGRTAANAAGYLASTVGTGIKGLFEARNLNPEVAAATAIESGAQGTRDLYGMVAQSEDPSSIFFKFKDFINGTGTVEDRKKQWLEARDFSENTRKMEAGQQTVSGIDPSLVNNDVKNALKLIADPTLFIPGIGEAMGAGKLGARVTGAAMEVAGRTAKAVTRPLVDIVDASTRIAGEAFGANANAVKGLAAGSGVTGIMMGVPGVREAAMAVGTVEGVNKAGQVLETAGQALGRTPTRIGALESLALNPNASAVDRALAKVGRYGGDDLIDIGARSAAGAVEGAAIGTTLGYLSGGEEGAAGGFGTGGLLGGAGAGAARLYGKASGAAAIENRHGDFNRFYETLDPETQAKFDTIVKQSGLDGASQVMDIAGLVRGKFNDADVRFSTGEEFAKNHGIDARGIHFPEGDRPIIDINVDKFSSQLTAGHELFHAFKAIDQLRPMAEKVESMIVGNYIIDGNGQSVKTSPGILSEADVLKRFDEYLGKFNDKDGNTTLPENDKFIKANTLLEKTKLVGEELGAEYMNRMIAGSNADSMLRGFDGLTRTLLDNALISDTEGFLRRTAQSIGLGSKPIESLIFAKLENASPALNATLRDMVRARRNMSERVEMIEGSGSLISRKDLSNPIAAKMAMDMGIAETSPDGVVRMRSNDVLAKEDMVSADALSNAIKSAPVVDASEPRMREVDGKIVGDGISNAQLSAIQSSPGIIDKLKKGISIVKDAMDNGYVIFIRNGKATKEIKSRLTGKKLKRYEDGFRITERDVVPFALNTSKAGNLYIATFDISKARNEAIKLAGRGNLGPYGSDFQTFYGDLTRYLNNLSDRVNAVPTKELLGDATKAAYLTDFFGGKDGTSGRYIRNFTLDRMIDMRLTGEKVNMSQLAYDRNARQFMPAENIGDGKVSNAPDSGFTIISKNGKHILYDSTKNKIGIYETQAKAEAKASTIQNLGKSITEIKKNLNPEDRKVLIEAEKKISETTNKYPEAVRLSIQRDKTGMPKISVLEDLDGNPMVDDNGKELKGINFEKKQYELRKAPGLSQDDNVAIIQGADLLHKSALKAQSNPDVAKGLGWYSRMREFFQRTLGADIEIFGQLLGATSARTPVDTNFKQALEAIRLFSTGTYDDLVQKYHQHVTNVNESAMSGALLDAWRKSNPGKKDSLFDLSSEIRKRINDFNDVPLRSNGAKYNANSKKVLQVLYGNWIDQTVGPKTPNFAGNLTGRTLAATIDVWAARNLRRLLYEGKQKQWRILPEQESGVSYTIDKNGVYGGDFVFAQKIYDQVAKRMGMNADDLQALMWFAEKDVWDKNGWTNKVGGEKSSFDKEAAKLNTSRYQAGVTTYKDKLTYSDKNQELARQQLRKAISNDPNLIASRVTITDGLYDGTIEPSLDVEFSLKKDSIPTAAIKEIVRIGELTNQSDVFISKVVDALDPNARPAFEIGFKKPATSKEIESVMAAFRTNGIDGFTVAKDMRGNIIGIRTQYIPEISGRYSPEHLDLTNYGVLSKKWMDNARKTKQSLTEPNISYANETHLSTHVIGRGEYSNIPQKLFGSSISDELGLWKHIIASEQVSGGNNPVSTAERGGSETVSGIDAGSPTSPVKFMPAMQFSAAENLPNGKIWRGENGYAIMQKEGGKFRVHSPIGLIGVAASYEAAEKMANKRNAR